MNVETFFQRFELLAEAPDAVARMRQIILELAVSARLVNTGGEWPKYPLKKLATKIGSGATPQGGRENYAASGVPLIRSMNVHFGGFEPKGLVYLSEAQARDLSNAVVQPDDVLLNITGASIGRVTTAPEEMSGARVNQHVLIIRPTKELLPRFLSLFLGSPSVQWMINDIEVGATRQALTKGMIERFEIPLPPLAEQKRIVAKVDELLALCDRLEAQQAEREARHTPLARAALARFAENPTPANLEYLFHPAYDVAPGELRQSILTLAMRGQLVSQDRCDGDATDLLDKIIAGGVKSETRRRASRRADRADDIDAPHSLPGTWTWTSLGTIADWGSGSTPPRGESALYGGSITWLKSGELNDNQALRGSSEQITQEALNAGSFRLNQPGDVLFAMYGATVGKAAILAEPAVTNQAVCGCTPCPGVDSHFLFYYLVSERQNFRDSSEGGAQPNFSKDKILTYPFPLPPLAEQRRIVAKVNQLMALVDQLEAQLAAAHDTGEKLMAAVVAELTAAK